MYCLTVPATSSFCLGNGVVVHNTRYLVASGVELMKIRPKEKEPEKQRVIDAGSVGLGWLGN